MSKVRFYKVPSAAERAAKAEAEDRRYASFCGLSLEQWRAIDDKTRDKKKLEIILGMIRDLTDSWRQIANSTANAPAAQVRGALNIQG